MKQKTKVSARKRIYEIINIGQKGDVLSILFDVFISILIFISVGITIAQTFEAVRPYDLLLYQIDAGIMIFFAVEYILRICTADYAYPDEKKSRSIRKFLFSFYGIIDLLTILTFFLPSNLSQGIVVLRLLRVIRIMRLFQLKSSYDAFNVITDVLKDKKEQIFSSVTMIMILMVISSIIMYALEHEAQPGAFDNAFSGIWWSVSALLTVGYGDIYPITVGGKIAAILISFLGVGMVAIPTGIISAGFVAKYSEMERESNVDKSHNFLTKIVEKEDTGKTVSDLALPTGIFVQAVVRDGKLMKAPRDLVLKEKDELMLCSKYDV